MATETPKYNLSIEQGITFSKTFTRTVLSIPGDDKSPRIPVDMTGVEARGSIRSRDGLPIATFLCTVNGAAGEVVLGLTHLTTAELDFGTAVYDVELLRDGAPFKRFLRGIVTLCKDVIDE